MWVFVKPCPRNPQKVTADHKKLVGSPPNIITIPQADSVCGVVNTWEFFTLWGLQRPGVSRGVIAIQTRINPMNPIYTLITAVMLTACVGSVSVPADETKKTDDPETEKMDEPKIPPPNPCIANPFGDTCEGAVFNDARKAACVRSNSNQCAPIIKRVCDINAFDKVCDGNPTYLAVRNDVCLADWRDHISCPPIKNKLFFSTGVFRNATRDNRFKRSSLIDTIRGGCNARHNSCTVEYPSSVDILHLNDNVGSATYRGIIQMAILTRSGQESRGILGTIQSYGETVNFQVNFSEKTINYQGGIAGSTTSVNARYNSKGYISGLVTFLAEGHSSNHSENLIGLIGETEMFGAFVGNAFAGGFTATRQ